MASSIQRDSKNFDSALYHHALIKIIVEACLKTKGDNWKRFLVQNHFIEVPKVEVVIKPRSSQHGKVPNP